MKEFYDIDKVQAYAELEIAGLELDLEQITKLLGLNISYIRKSDDRKGFTRAGVEISPPENKGEVGVWKYKTAEKGTYDTEAQLDELIRVFRSKTAVLREIREQYQCCTIKVNVVVTNKQRLSAVHSVRAAQIRFLAGIGVGLYYDIYHQPRVVIRCYKKPRLLEKKTERSTEDGE